MASEDIFMDQDTSEFNCAHANIEYYSEEEKRIHQIKMSGYCIDCGEPFSDAVKISTSVCSHPSVKEDVNGVNVCTVCFIEMTEQLSFEPEWNRYSDNSSSRSSKDPSRCHGQRGPSIKGLSSIFEEHKIQIDRARLSRIEEKYKHITSQSASKGQCRTGIIAACLFKDLQKTGDIRTTEYVRGLFNGLTKKRMSEGLSIYYGCYPDESKEYITATDLIPWLLTKMGIDKEHEERIKKLTDLIVSGDPSFKRATPQSVASSVIYFYLCLNPNYKKSLGMNKTKFAEKSGLSDLTITKLVTAISDKTKHKIDI